MATAKKTAPRRRTTITTEARQETVQRTAGAIEGTTPIDPAEFVDEDKEEKVTVTIPNTFDLTLDTGRVIRYKAGVDEMPISHATHWFSKNRGVEIYKPDAKE